MTNLPPKVSDPIEIATLSKNIVTEVLRFVDKKREEKGDKFAEQLSSQFLASFIASLVYRTLKYGVDDKETDQQKALDQAITAFTGIRADIQEAVSAGVAGAIATATGKSIEYYTQIKVVPEPVNKQPC